MTSILSSNFPPAAEVCLPFWYGFVRTMLISENQKGNVADHVVQLALDVAKNGMPKPPDEAPF